MNLESTIFLVCLLATAAISDLRSQKIPNVLTYPAMVLALMYHAWSKGMEGVVFSAEGWSTGLGLLLVPFFLSVMGAGDVKLMAAVGAILGPMRTLNAFLFVCIAGGIYALVVLVIRRRDCVLKIAGYMSMIKEFPTTGSFIPVVANKQVKSPGLSYGLAITIGTITSVSLELMGWVLPL